MRRRRNLRRVPTTEASRRCSLVGFLKEIRCSFWGPLLRGFATGICLLADQNLVTSRIGIGPDMSDVCLLFFLSAPFSSRSVDVRLCFLVHTHTHAHTLCVLTAGKSSFRLERSGRPFPTPITLFCSASRTFQHLRAPACFGRWHSPQVALAAPPAPR